MAKPMKTLELHYPMIQFLIISIILFYPEICGLLDFLYTLTNRQENFPISFSNSLIIHQAKTKKITTVKEVLIPVLIRIDFDDFTS